uniref:Uncharacterized protein n=1 Tax=Oryza glumipatula TaxID=40148 RepID=A0A0E0B058_9ORYZ
MDGIEELVEVEEAVVLQDDADAVADDEGVDEFAKTRERNLFAKHSIHFFAIASKNVRDGTEEGYKLCL